MKDKEEGEKFFLFLKYETTSLLFVSSNDWLEPHWEVLIWARKLPKTFAVKCSRASPLCLNSHEIDTLVHEPHTKYVPLMTPPMIAWSCMTPLFPAQIPSASLDSLLSSKSGIKQGESQDQSILPYYEHVLYHLSRRELKLLFLNNNNNSKSTTRSNLACLLSRYTPAAESIGSVRFLNDATG